MILYYSTSKTARTTEWEWIEPKEDVYVKSLRYRIADEYFAANRGFGYQVFFVFDEEGKMIDSFNASTSISYTIKEEE